MAACLDACKLLFRRLSSPVESTSVRTVVNMSVASQTLPVRGGAAEARRGNVQAQRPPAAVGDDVGSIDTPALIVDLDRMESNMRQMAAFVAQHPNIQLRPHGKAHKTPDIARLAESISAGRGVCVQKVSEAEAFVQGGIGDVYVSNEVVELAKLRRLMGLVAERGARISICVDSVEGVNNLAQAAQERGVSGVNVLVDCNVGQNRCGVQTAAEAVALARLIRSHLALQFVGIQTYQGSAQHYRTVDERRAAAQSVAVQARAIESALAADGFKCEIITGAGSGTYKYEVEAGALTEIQCGSYIFNDGDYGQNQREDGTIGNEWQQSLYVLTTVMSVNPSGRWVVVDGGIKSFAVDSGVPQPAGLTNVTTASGGDEHCIITFLDPAATLPSVGTRIRLIPSHCDPTVNMYDWIVGVRGSTVETVWEITGSGPGQ